MNTGENFNVHVKHSEIMDNSKEKMDCKNAPSKKKVRPTQRLYVPPAQRNKKKSTNAKHEDAIESGNSSNSSTAESQQKSEETEMKISPKNNTDSMKIKKTEGKNTVHLEKEQMMNNCASSRSLQENVSETTGDGVNVQRIESTKNDESLVIMLNSLKASVDKVDVDVEQEEMKRAIVNINRKSRPLIRHVNVGNSDVLHIDVDDKEVVCKSKKSVKNVYEQITNWEDLFNEDECDCNGQFMKQIVNYIDDKGEELSEDETNLKKNVGVRDLEHVIELYDFPPTFKTQDLMQLYHDVNEESMYIKWCDETHALLVLSTPAQAKKALQIGHDIIKSRSMLQASLIAVQVASRYDLKPAMKRPQTNMQTARRLITSHLGTRSRISREEQQREQDELRKAKELKRALRQSENDAWDGHPRPSTT